VFVGSGTVIMEGAKVEDNVWIQSGTVVSPGMLLESGRVYGGISAKDIGEYTDFSKLEIMIEVLNRNMEE